MLPKPLCIALALCCFKPSLVGIELTTLSIQTRLSRMFVVEREVKIDSSTAVDLLPHAGPRIGPPPVGADCAFAPRQPRGDCGAIMLAFALAVAQCEWILHAMLAVPIPGRHLIETGTEDMARPVATVTQHQLFLVSKVLAYHAGFPGRLEQILVDDHGRVQLGHLLFVLDTVR